MNDQQAILDALARIEKLLQAQLDDTATWTKYVKARDILVDERDTRYEIRYQEGLAQQEQIVANNKRWQEQDITMRKQEMERLNRFMQATQAIKDGLKKNEECSQD